jgi:hypothetical protein
VHYANDPDWLNEPPPKKVLEAVRQHGYQPPTLNPERSENPDPETDPMAHTCSCRGGIPRSQLAQIFTGIGAAGTGVGTLIGALYLAVPIDVQTTFWLAVLHRI